MVKVNPKTITERPIAPRNPFAHLTTRPSVQSRIVVPESTQRLANYRIPKVKKHQNDSSEPQPSTSSGSHHESRSRSRKNSPHRRDRSRTPRAPRRDASFERARKQEDLRTHLQRKSHRQTQHVDFRDEIEIIPPERTYRVNSPYVRDHSQVRFITPKTTHVMKFDAIPLNIDIVTFLTLLSRSMRGVTGCAREYDYAQGMPGPAIYIFAIDQPEVDAATERGFEFLFENGPQTLRPRLVSASIVSVHQQDVAKDLAFVPTIMLRNLNPINAKHAIASAIDAAQIVTQQSAYVTYVRLPARNYSFTKTSSLAFVGVNHPDIVQRLNGTNFERCAKTIPMNKSEQFPVLIPVALARQRSEEGWSNRAAAANLLIKN